MNTSQTVNSPKVMPLNREAMVRSGGTPGASSHGNIFSPSGSFAIEETKLEKDVLQKEKQWLLSHEVPFICNEIRRILQLAIESLNIRTDPYKKPSKDTKEEKGEEQTRTPSLVSFDSQSGLVNGSLRIDGYHITEAEVIVKSEKYKKGATNRITIQSNTPLKLTQLNNSFNFVKMASSKARELDYLSSSTQDDRIKEMLRVIGELGSLLKNATDEFLFGPQSLFPKSNYVLVQPNLSFIPPLPPELVIEFFIQNNQLQVSCFIMQKGLASSGGPGATLKDLTTNIAGGGSNTSQHSSPYVGQRVRLPENTFMDIMDHAQAQGSGNYLKSISELITAAHQLCEELHDKLSLFI